MLSRSPIAGFTTLDFAKLRPAREKEFRSLTPSTDSGSNHSLSRASSASSCNRAEPEDSALARAGAHCGALVGNLPPWAFVGDMDLPRESDQEAIAMCAKDCKLSDLPAFDSCVREHLDEKQCKDMRVLCRSVPGMKALTPSDRSATMKHFQKTCFPAGHVFFEQGQRAKRAIFVIVRGSVGLFCNDISKFSGLPMPGSRRHDVLYSGKVFGSLGAAPPERFTVRCTAPCEVFCVTGEALKKLPSSLLEEVFQHLAHDSARHAAQIEALPSKPSTAPRGVRRSLSSSLLQRSPVEVNFTLPRAVRWSNNDPEKRPLKSFKDEQTRIGNQCIGQETLVDTPVPSPIREPSSSPSLRRFGATFPKTHVQRRRKCPAVAWGHKWLSDNPL